MPPFSSSSEGSEIGGVAQRFASDEDEDDDEDDNEDDDEIDSFEMVLECNCISARLAA